MAEVLAIVTPAVSDALGAPLLDPTDLPAGPALVAAVKAPFVPVYVVDGVLTLTAGRPNAFVAPNKAAFRASMVFILP